MPDGYAKVTALAKLFALCMVAGLLVAGIVFPFAGGLGLLSNEANDTVNSVSTDLASGELPLMTTVTDKDGVPIAYLYDQYRVPARSQDISLAMKGAIIAIEDKRFYEHQGVDWQGTVRALVRNQASGDIEQGASTLTQQYVKNYLLYVVAKTASDRLKATEPTYARKLKEARIALEVERQLSKDEILTRYLNIVFLGNNAYGVAAASRTYFGTTPDTLTVPQAALLAGMVQSSVAFDPVRRPDAALQRRNEVIRQMQQQGMINQAQATAGIAAPLGVVSPLNTLPNGCIGAGDAGFFCKYVVDYLSDAGISPDQLNHGGYTVRTTLDRNMLTQTKSALNAEVPPTQPHVANVMTVVQPGQQKHRVLAMAANRVFGLDGSKLQTSYGLPFQPVPFGAGSVYKIFTAAVALDKGLGINYVMDVPPSGYTSPIYKDGNGNPIPVRNAGSYAPQMTMQQALATSPNTAFVKLEEFTGVPPVVDMAVKLGMRSLATTPATSKPGGPSLADQVKSEQQASFTLGVTPTPVVELANVGATLGSSGMWCPPTPIESVADAAGKPVTIPEPPCEQAVAPSLADTMMTGLSLDDQGAGTSAAAAGAVGWNRPVAAKTGTTQQHKSAAFVGFTPGISGAVITYDNTSSPQPLCDGGGADPPFACSSGNIYGGKTPARTWYRAMTAILANAPVQPLPPTDPRYVEGGENARVPDVIGMGVNDAVTLLETAGFKVTQRTVDNRAPAGTVVGESPHGSAIPGQTIRLQVSSGSVPPPPPPPDSQPPIDIFPFPGPGQYGGPGPGQYYGGPAPGQYGGPGPGQYGGPVTPG